MALKSIKLQIIIAVLAFMTLAILAGSFRKVQIWMDLPPSLAPHIETARDIDTNGKLWLNGYLGIFFRFKYFGRMNWLAIPLGVYFILTVRKRKRWERALFSAYILSVLLISVKGYYNFRYQLTVFPLTVSLVLLYGWEMLKERGKAAGVIAFLICGGLIGASYYSLWEDYRVHQQHNVSGEDDSFPYVITRLLNALEDDAMVLECDQPILYYHTNKRGIHYIDKRLLAVYKIGNRGEVLKILKDQFHVQYILTSFDTEKMLKGMGLDIINQIAMRDCDLVYEEKGYKLFKFKDSSCKLKNDELKMTGGENRRF